MESMAKRAFYIGVCAAAVTKKFVEAEVRHALDAGNISEQEGKKIVNAAIKQLKKDKAYLEKTVKKDIQIGLREAKPIMHEGKVLVEELAKELVKDAKSTVRARANSAVSKIKNSKLAKRVTGKVAKKIVRRAKKSKRR